MVQAWFSCFKRSLGDPTFFLMDTGSSGSFLSEIEAKRLGIDYSTLRLLPEDDWVMGIGGKLPLYRMDDECKLTFQTFPNAQGRREYHVETFAHFDVIKVEIADSKLREQILAGIPSILGMDVLRNFKFTATNDEAYLDT